MSLIEALIVITMLSIVSALAVPNLGRVTQRARVSALQSEFASALALARAEAMRTGAVARLEALSAQAGSNEFGNGWRVWIDLDGDGSLGPADRVMRRHDAVADTRVRANPAAVPGGSVSALAFGADGFLSQPATRIAFCSSAGGRGAALTITRNGLTDADENAACS